MLPFAHSHFGRGQRARAQPIAAGDIDYGAAAVPLNLNTVVGPSGLQPAPGDMMFVSGTVSGGAGVAWTALPSGARMRRLVAGDFTANLNFSVPVAWSIYRGPVNAVVKSSRSAPNARTHPGFTKSPYCVGLVFIGRANSSTTAGVTLGAPWTLRAGSSGPGNNESERVYDLLDPLLYIDGAAVIAGASHNGSSLTDLLELTF